MLVGVGNPLLVCHTGLSSAPQAMTRLTITAATAQLQDVGLTLNEYVDWLRETRQLFTQASLDRYLAG